MEIKKPKRPPTPKVEIGTADSQVIVPKNRKELIFKNFSNFMRQIIDNQNENFLSGSLNIFDYLLAKYLEVPATDIPKLEKIQIQINGDYGLLNRFGERLQNLKILKLNNSFIQSISDLGSNFKTLKILEINNCKLKELSGLICFEQLQIFTAKNNLIDDLIEMEMCSSLEQIDLENNYIENEDNLYFLSSLDKLKSINLKGNPIKNYKDKLKELIPSLESIDEELKLHEIEEAIISFEPDFQNSSSANASHSTNENSSEFSNEQSKTKTNFYSNASSTIKKENIEEDKNILNNKEINFSQTMTNFKINRNKLAPLNPIIMKKEEDSNIKDLRESIQIHHNTKDKIPLTTMNKDNKEHKLINEPKASLLSANNKSTTSGMTMTHKPVKNSFLSSTVTVKKKLEKVVVNKGPVKSSLGIFTQGQKKIDFPVSMKKK